MTQKDEEIGRLLIELNEKRSYLDYKEKECEGLRQQNEALRKEMEIVLDRQTQKKLETDVETPEIGDRCPYLELNRKRFVEI